MELNEAIKRLSALAQDARLEVFRLLVKAGSEGVAAGEIARAMGSRANTLSAQLLVLSNAQLVKARREGRSIIYSANFDAMRDLLLFLTKDCCAQSRDIVASTAKTVARSCCKPRTKQRSKP